VRVIGAEKGNQVLFDTYGGVFGVEKKFSSRRL
jgi:hypothetical protein